MHLMKKVIEDLQMSLNEKDAEIINLNMHLGDEKKKNSSLLKSGGGPMEGGLTSTNNN